jgi:hypothetical protein
VLDSNDDGRRKFTQRTAYLVRVEERFRGLDASQKEVFVDPGSFSSGYTHYEVGRRYLFIARGPASFVAMTVIKGEAPTKAFPARWSTKRDLKVYTADVCSPTREASMASEDIAWLRGFQRGIRNTRVFGVVLQNSESFYRPHGDEDVPLPGASITLHDASQSFTTTSGADGRYSFEGIPAGTYQISAKKTNWTPSRSIDVDLHPGGCAHRDLSLEANSEVTGRLLDHNSKPIHDVRVELVRVLPGGNIARSYTNWADTDEQGNYYFKRVAAGTFVLGVNVGSAPTEREPYPATFYPGVRALASATRLTLEPNEKLGGLVLRLPAPMVKRKVLVRVHWADGSPVQTEARAFADFGDSRAAVGQAKSGNKVELTLLEDLAYTLSADWFSLSGAPIHHIGSVGVALSAGRGPATLDIRLKRNKP